MSKKLTLVAIIAMLGFAAFADVWQLKVKDLNGKWHTQNISKTEYQKLYPLKIKVEEVESKDERFTKVVHTELSTAQLDGVQRAKLIHLYEIK